MHTYSVQHGMHIMEQLTLSIVMVHIKDVAQLMGGCAPNGIYTRPTVLTKTYGTDSTHCTNKCNTNCATINVNVPVD